MCHTSPTVELVWTALCVTLLCYLVSHLWAFDRFKCIKVWEGRGNGAFKKVMTLSYLIAVPLILVRSMIMAVIKYQEGYMMVPGYGIIPKPYIFWPKDQQRWIFPAQLCFAIAWSFEWVSHLEELCFWLFLTNPSPLHMAWFGSVNFWVWSIGSVAGLVLMPVIAVWKRDNPLKMEAWIIVVGSIGSTLITVVFFRVLWIFPGFLKRVRTEGAGQDVVTRLVTFHKLNLTRVCFRLLFTVPLLVLGIDGVRHHNPVNESSFWTDLLAICGGIGCIVSSILTLVIFFPRSMAREAGYDSRIRSASRWTASREAAEANKSFFNSPNADSNPFATPLQTVEYKNATFTIDETTAQTPHEEVVHEVRLPPVQFKYPPAKKPKAPKRPPPTIHPMIMNYRSPIDVMDQDERGAILPTSNNPRPGYI